MPISCSIRARLHGCSVALSAFLVVAIVGCAGLLPPRIDWSDPDAVAAGTRSERDDDTGVTRWLGPAYDAGDYRYLLRAVQPAAGADADLAVELYVAAHYRGYQWRAYTQAFDAEGRALPFAWLNRAQVDCTAYTGDLQGGCAVVERFTAALDLERLRTAGEGGYAVTVHSNAGHASTLVLPAAYVRGFLRRADGGALGRAPNDVAAPRPAAP